MSIGASALSLCSTVNWGSSVFMISYILVTNWTLLQVLFALLVFGLIDSADVYSKEINMLLEILLSYNR